jgi:ribosomal protein S5, bacterial/organelle type
MYLLLPKASRIAAVVGLKAGAAIAVAVAAAGATTVAARSATPKWQERVVQIRRVSKTVKGGKKMSFRAIVVVGNEKGQVGVGVGKAGDVIGAVRKGVADGKKHLVKVPLTRHSSIPTVGNGRDGAASVLIRPAAPGTGVIAGGSIRTVLELAGIKNVLAKRLGSKTPLNNARAAMDALAGLRTHKETAKERGISLEQIYS